MWQLNLYQQALVEPRYQIVAEAQLEQAVEPAIKTVSEPKLLN